MAEQFKIGDVVQLASGGPKMTVNYVDVGHKPFKIWCLWFDRSEEVKKGEFSADSLRAIPAESP